jgi:hypothetical protein
MRGKNGFLLSSATEAFFIAILVFLAASNLICDHVSNHNSLRAGWL